MNHTLQNYNQKPPPTPTFSRSKIWSCQVKFWILNLANSRHYQQNSILYRTNMIAFRNIHCCDGWTIEYRTEWWSYFTYCKSENFLSGLTLGLEKEFSYHYRYNHGADLIYSSEWDLGKILILDFHLMSIRVY